MMNHSSQKNTISQGFSGVFPIWKRRGETLAVLMERFRKEQVVPADTKITYAGRLDPAAEGLMLLLVGEARMEKEKYLALDKTYLLTILFGVQTDTADFLGVPLLKKESGKIEGIEKVLQSFIGAVTLPYPAYSSKPVAGKPLFAHARAGKIVPIPEKEVFIHSIELVAQETVSAEALLARAQELTEIVIGDFRQEEIKAAWEQLLQEEGIFPLITIRVHASSGTYMRSLTEAIGTKLGVPACAFAIARERTGDFTLAGK